MADEGYDVWLGNARGTVYSTNHTTLNPFGSRNDRRLFWDYSVHEIGIYDLPASIDYILNETGETKINYIGHSQGSLVFFIMASERPEYQNKIELMHAIGPAVFIGHTTSSPMRALAPWAKSITVRHSTPIFVYFTPNLIAAIVFHLEHWQSAKFLLSFTK